MYNKLLSTFRLWIWGLQCSRVAELAIAHVVILAFTLPVVAEEYPSPVALLRGVEVARTQSPSLKATLEIQYILPPPATTIECVVELDGDKRRFEVFTGKVPGQVIIRDGDEFHGFVRKKNEDVHIYDLQRALGVRGDVAFDPRVLGLDDLVPCNVTVKDCLWYHKSKKLEVVGQESLHGIKTWRVRATRDDVTSDYWIEEPSFRVHRRTLTRHGTKIEIESEFDSNPPLSPFPSRVIAKRTDPARKHEVIYIVKSFDVGVRIPPDRFTLKSMDLPINTPVVDYRISRIVGYWDGEGLSKEPVYRGQQPSAPRSTPPTPPARNRFLLIAINVFVLLVSITVLLLRWRRRSTQTQ